MISTTGIIPEELLKAEKKAEVITRLIFSPYPSYFKRALLQGWADQVGLKLTPRDFGLVERSGIDLP